MSFFKMSQYEGLAAEGRISPYMNTSSTAVLVMLDLRSIAKSMSRGRPGAGISLGKLNVEAVNGRRCVSAFAVDGKPSEDEAHHAQVQSMVKEGGFRLLAVPAAENFEQESAGIMLALKAQEFVLTGKCSRVVLITGDGDFACLAKSLQSIGTVVEVMAFEDSLNGCLKDAADKVTLLDELPLIRIRNSEEASPKAEWSETSVASSGDDGDAMAGGTEGVPEAAEDGPGEESEYEIHDIPDDASMSSQRSRALARLSSLQSGIRFVPYKIINDEEGTVTYKGAGTIASSLLLPCPYMAFLSPNGKVLQLIPCEKGDIQCEGQTIRIGLLEALMQGRTECSLDFENDDDVLTVRLD